MPRCTSNRTPYFRLFFLLITLAGLTNSYLVASATECGEQRFHATTNYGVASAARSLALGDFDGDGSLDVVLAHHGADYISVSLNNGNGVYSVPVTYQVKSGPYFVVTGDFNADGKLDVATAGFNSNIGSRTGFVSVLLGDGTGGFGQLTSSTMSH